MLRALLLRLAPVVRCERCGRPLFRGIALVAGGRLYLYGAEDESVSVEWSSRRTLRFRHDNRDRCTGDARL